MAKEKMKYSHPFSIRMEDSIYERLTKFCEESGQSKTTAVERAVMMYIDDYEEKQKKLSKDRK